jgi:hypothetical protein
LRTTEAAVAAKCQCVNELWKTAETEVMIVVMYSTKVFRRNSVHTNICISNTFVNNSHRKKCQNYLCIFLYGPYMNPRDIIFVL